MNVGKMKLTYGRELPNSKRKKQALAVALELEGRAKEIAMEISADELDDDNGMDKLLEKLDDVFQLEEKDRAYEAYTQFDRLTKDGSVSMSDHIIDFEQRYNRMRKFNNDHLQMLSTTSHILLWN